MPNKPNFKLLLVCLALILSANVAGFGCWCVDAGPVLDQVEKSKFVIVGRLASISDAKAKIVVERVYKGWLKAGDQLDFVQGQFGDCIRGFGSGEIGQQYLFYLNSPSNARLYTASICNRSNKVARAFDDLAYLDKIGEVAGKTRLSGYFKTSEANIPNVEGLVIKITGKKNKKSYSVTTDKNGFFELYDLLPGDYIIEPQTPAGWRIDVKYMFGIDDRDSTNLTYLVTVKAKRHTATRITITNSQRVL
jgi:hypothetical protein